MILLAPLAHPVMRNPGIGVAQVHEVRIGPRVAGLARATWRRDDFDQPLRVHAGRRHPRDSRASTEPR